MSTKLSDAIKTVNRALITCGSLGALTFVSLPAVAQDAESIEEVQVLGIRGSIQKSMDVKRDSKSIVDVITAEDMGKFPDKNVAESLQRVPGVTIQRQFGEGAAVSIRGAGVDLTLTTLNGQNVASTGWFVLDQARRSFNYELLPSELVGNLEVYKSSRADLLEGGVGGTVVVNTRKPLDLDANTAYASIEGGYGDDSEQWDPMLSGMYSFKNNEETIGVMVSAVYQERALQRQGNEAFWEWGAGPVAFTNDRKRQALTATLQYQPTDSLEFALNVMDMQMEANNTNYALWLTQADTSWGSGTTTDWIDGTQAAGPLNVAYYQARPREATMNSDVVDLEMNFHGDGFQVHAQVGSTNSTGGTDFEAVFDDGTGGTPIVGGTYDFTGGGQTWDLPNGIQGASLSEYNPGSIVMGTGSAFNATPKTDGEDYLQGDIEFDVELGPITSIKTGARYAEHETTSRQFQFTQDPTANLVLDTSGITSTLDVGAGGYSILHVSDSAMKNLARASITGRVENLGSYSNVQEDNAAAYVMANFETDGISGDFGVRYVQTEASSIYYVGTERRTESGDYSEVLPSLNVKMDLTDELILRTSAARVMARPQYGDMYYNPDVRGANDDLPSNQFYVLGSPGLLPYVANQYDVGLEWYFDNSAMVSFALFKKDVANFVTFSNEENVATDDLPVPGFGGTLRPDELEWTVQRKANGNKGDIRGFELQYQQSWDSGFGTIVNYTYTDATTSEDSYTDKNEQLSDSSEHAYNLTGYYENDMFQARLSYNWRSEYMIREVGSYGNRLHDDFGSLDFSSSMHVTDNIDLKLDVINITGESSHQYGNNNYQTNYSGFAEGFPLYEYEQARRIVLGASVKF